MHPAQMRLTATMTCKRAPMYVCTADAVAAVAAAGVCCCCISSTLPAASSLLALLSSRSRANLSAIFLFAVDLVATLMCCRTSTAASVIGKLHGAASVLCMATGSRALDV